MRTLWVFLVLTVLAQSSSLYADNITAENFENPKILENISHLQGNPLPLSVNWVTLNYTATSVNHMLEFRKLKQDQSIYIPVNANSRKQQFFHFMIFEREALVTTKFGLKLSSGSQVLWFSPSQMIYMPNPLLPAWTDVFIAFEELSPAQSLQWEAVVIQPQNDLVKLSLDEISVLDEIDFIKSFAPTEVLNLQDFEEPLFSTNEIQILQGKNQIDFVWGRRGRGRCLGMQINAGNSPTLFYLPMVRRFAPNLLKDRKAQFWFRGEQNISEFKLQWISSDDLERLFKSQRQDFNWQWFKTEGQNWKKLEVPFPVGDVSGVLMEIPAGVSETIWLDDWMAVSLKARS